MKYRMRWLLLLALSALVWVNFSWPTYPPPDAQHVRLVELNVNPLSEALLLWAEVPALGLKRGVGARPEAFTVRR